MLRAKELLVRRSQNPRTGPGTQTPSSEIRLLELMRAAAQRVPARLHRTLEPATQGLFDLALDAFLRFGSLGFRRSRLPPPNSTGADLWVLSGSKSPPANQ